jgi:hypothetical protein
MIWSFMDSTISLSTWRGFAVAGVVLCLLALFLSPVPAVGLALSLVLAPVLLFGLVLVPQSLWPAADREQTFAAPILSRVPLFQRPPPFSVQ